VATPEVFLDKIAFVLSPIRAAEDEDLDVEDIIKCGVIHEHQSCGGN
jgi:hypothetical protein